MHRILSTALLLLLSGVAAANSATDNALADTIERLTNRETADLKPIVRADGRTDLDLKERFQQAVIARLDKGEITAACVSSLGEANAFFERDLRTGAALPKQARDTRSERQRRADLHGMTPLEYQFYWNLIEQDAANTAKRPKASTITIVNNDAAGEGFNDPSAPFGDPGNGGATRGQERLNVFTRAAEIWGAFLDSNVPIQVRANFDPLTPCSSGGGVLGSAGPLSSHQNFANAPFANTVYPAALANKISGSDLSANPDISARFNADVDTSCLGGSSRFYYGLDNATPPSRINLLVVVLHEIGHGLGSLSFANVSTGAYSGNPDIWARFQRDATTGLTWFEMSNAQRAASAINTNNLFWIGPNTAIASSFLTAGRDPANGTVQLFTPNPVQGGSSVSHWSTATSPNLLMEPSINSGIPLTLDLSRQQMRDIGWYRDTTADLVRDTIINVTPSGSNVAQGATVNVTWNNTGGFNRTVSIDLSTDGGASFPTAVATNIVNTGSFSWTVPNTPTTTARLRVREHDFVEPAGVSAANFSIGAPNTAPTFTPNVAINRQRGSPPGSAVTIGTVSDAQSAAGSLVVTQVAGGTASGITVGTISNSSGTISAPLSASCTATSGSVRFQVFDGSLSGTGELSINVTANTLPVLAYSGQNVNGGSGLVINPSSPISDNGQISSVVINSPGSYTGGISVDAAGSVTLSNAAPIGNHSITVRATDNCGATTDATIALTVNNTAPTITAAAALARQQGSPAGAEVVLASVSDAQTAVGALVVTQIAGGSASGITLGAINNVAGSIRGTVLAACNASSGTVLLQVSDGGLSASAPLTINVSANTAPVQGVYPNTYLNLGASGNVTPSLVPSDNGSISTLTAAASPPAFTGTLNTTLATGVVAVGNVGPLGSYTVTVTATDNCAATSTRTFTLGAGDLIFRDGFGP